MDIFPSALHIIAFAILGIFPGIIWLLFFLREDVNPEPARMILRVFFMGAFCTIPVIAIFVAIEPYFYSFFSYFAAKIILIALMVPIIEELAKFSVIKFSVLKDPECDEPVDIMIYAISAALGFATIENILFLLPSGDYFSIQQVVMGSLLRFITSTLLHATASGIMGYFLALSVLRIKRKNLFFFGGLIAAILLHAFYNLLLLLEDFSLSPLLLSLLLIGSLITLLLLFKKLRKIPVFT